MIDWTKVDWVKEMFSRMNYLNALRDGSLQITANGIRPVKRPKAKRRRVVKQSLTTE